MKPSDTPPLQRPAQANAATSRPTSVSSPLFKNQADWDRFMRDFSGSAIKAAAPVQSDKNGWENYLSRRELKDYDRARANMNRGNAAAIGLFLAKTGAMLFLTASVAPAFSLVLGTAAAIGGTYGLASWAKALRIQKRGERREAEAEVSARHAKTPQGPRV